MLLKEIFIIKLKTIEDTKPNIVPSMQINALGGPALNSDTIGDSTIWNR